MIGKLGEPGLRVDIVGLGGLDEGGRSLPRTGSLRQSRKSNAPQNARRCCPSCTGGHRRETGERVPLSEVVLDRVGDIVPGGELGALPAHQSPSGFLCAQSPATPARRNRDHRQPRRINATIVPGTVAASTEPQTEPVPCSRTRSRTHQGPRALPDDKLRDSPQPLPQQSDWGSLGEQSGKRQPDRRPSCAA
jgi:hypothetical protein